MIPLLDQLNLGVTKDDLGKPGWYGDWFVKWTGFKSNYQVDFVDTLLYAQWVAYPRDKNGEGFYASSPGACWTCKRGHRFDVRPEPGQLVMSCEDLDHMHSAIEKGKRIRAEELERLRTIMREAGVEPPL